MARLQQLKIAVNFLMPNKQVSQSNTKAKTYSIAELTYFRIAIQPSFLLLTIQEQCIAFI